MHITSGIGFIAASFCSLSALAQPVIDPQCFFWQGQPEPPHQPDSKFAPMFTIPLRAYLPSANTNVCLDTPQRAAEWLAYAIKAEHDADPVFGKWINADGSNVMILVRHFGYEDRPNDKPDADDVAAFANAYAAGE